MLYSLRQIASRLRKLGQDTVHKCALHINSVYKFFSIDMPDLVIPSAKTQNLVDRVVVKLISSCIDERRSNDMHFLASGVNKMSQGRIYPILSGAMNICLPDEPYPVMALLYKSQYVDWHLKLQEKITRRKVELTSMSLLNRRKVGRYGFDHFGELSFRFRNSVASRSIADLITLELISDLSGMRYSVTFNDTNCAYRSVILEEISNAIGKDGLFKRSLLLIKAWCLYELPRFCRVIPSTHDTKSTQFATPLDVLIGFLTEYSTFAWDSFALTTLGKISKDSILRADEMPSAQLVSGTYSVKFSEIIKKHRASLHSDSSDDGSLSPPLNQSTNAPSSSPPSGTSSGGLSLSHSASIPSIVQLQQETELFADLKHSISLDHTVYILDGLIPMFNVAQGNHNGTQIYCDLNGESQQTRMVSNLDVMKMIGLDFLTGLSNLREAISTVENTIHIADEIANKSNLLSLDDPRNTFLKEVGKESYLFPGICHKVDLWATQSRIIEKRDLSLTNLRNIVDFKESESFLRHYKLLEGQKNLFAYIVSDTELLVRSKVTADAVAHTIAHLLEREGRSQTIGEIGKMLQEVVGNPNLTRIIKTNFRGLKRLITLYPGLFRLGDEHSFNPHIHLMPGAINFSAHVRLQLTTENDTLQSQTLPQQMLLSHSISSYPRSESSSVASGVSDKDYGGYGSNDDSEGIPDDNTPASNIGGIATDGLDVYSPTVNLRVSNFGGSTAMSLSMLDPGASEFTFTGSTHAQSPKQQTFSSQPNRGIIQPKMFLNNSASATNIDAFAYHGGGDALPQHYDDSMLDDLQLRSQVLSTDPYGGSSFMTANGSQSLSSGNLYAAGSASSVIGGIHRPGSVPLSSLQTAPLGNSMGPSVGATLALTPNAISPRHSKGSVQGQNLLMPNPRMGHPGHPAINAAAASIALTKQPKSQGPSQKKEAKQIPLPINSSAVGNSGTIVIPSPSNRELVGVSVTPPPYITSASGATIVDPSTGSKIYNPVKPEVWVPGKFAGATNPDLVTPAIPGPPNSIGIAVGVSKNPQNISPPPYSMGTGNSSMAGVGDFISHGLVDGMSGPGYRMGYANNASMDMPFGSQINGGGQFPHHSLSYGHVAALGDQNISKMSSLLSGHDELEMNGAEASVFGLSGMNTFDPTAHYGQMHHVSGHISAHMPVNVPMSNMNMTIPSGIPMMAGGSQDGGVFNYSLSGRERGASGDAAWLPNFLRDL